MALRLRRVRPETRSLRPLLERLDDPKDPLDIIPRPTDEAVGVSTIDLHVGSIFLSARRSSIPAIDVRDLRGGMEAFEEVRIYGEHDWFMMQPHQFVLASTYEYLCLPDDLGGNIQSRSTFGRMGLIAATAAYIGPGYRGSPTLELVNTGEVPVQLKPYTPICQLVVLPAAGAAGSVRPSRYHLATRPSSYRPEWSARWRALDEGEQPGPEPGS